MSTLSQFSGGIKSIQRGTISIANGATSGTSTVTAVVTAKTELRYLGINAASTAATAHIVLTDTTTVTATRTVNSGDIAVSWELTEFY